jgi:hypothetical protein
LDELLTTAEAAAVIGCTVSRVRQLARDGAFKGIVERSPRFALIPQSEAERIRDNPATVGRRRKFTRRTRKSA